MFLSGIGVALLLVVEPNEVIFKNDTPKRGYIVLLYPWDYNLPIKETTKPLYHPNLHVMSISFPVCISIKHYSYLASQTTVCAPIISPRKSLDITLYNLRRSIPQVPDLCPFGLECGTRSLKASANPETLKLEDSPTSRPLVLLILKILHDLSIL